MDKSSNTVVHLANQFQTSSLRKKEEKTWKKGKSKEIDTFVEKKDIFVVTPLHDIYSSYATALCGQVRRNITQFQKNRIFLFKNDLEQLLKNSFKT